MRFILLMLFSSSAFAQVPVIAFDSVPEPLKLPQDLYFTVGDSLAHARLTFVRECSVGASLECHSG